MKDHTSAVRVPCRGGATPRASHGQGELSEQELLPPWLPCGAKWNWDLRLEPLTCPAGA